jgi:hypothetical protein
MACRGLCRGGCEFNAVVAIPDLAMRSDRQDELLPFHPYDEPDRSRNEHVAP